VTAAAPKPIEETVVVAAKPESMASHMKDPPTSEIVKQTSGAASATTPAPNLPPPAIDGIE